MGNESSLVATGNDPRRQRIVLGAALLALATMAQVFWDEDLRYSLPTPRPSGLRQAARGSQLELPAALAARLPRADGRPVLLHFYNPDCPCSRFNRDHVHALRLRYAEHVQIVDVLETPQELAGEVDAATPWVADPDGSIAEACGIYSTPQALLLDAQRRIVFRGNFNTSRWCNATATQFVRQAIEALLHGVQGPVDPRAELSYGCALPQDDADARSR